MKKRLYSLLLLTAFLLSASAQDGTLPMLEDGMEWSNVYVRPGTSCEYTNLWGHVCEGFPEKFFIDGDSVMNGRTYKMCWSENWKKPQLIRQEGSRIFCFDDGNHNEKLCYDFGLEKGDTIYYNYYKMWVDRVDTVCVNGISRRRLFMYWEDVPPVTSEEDIPTFGSFADIWVEGIGGAAETPWGYPLSFMTSASYIMQECTKDGQQLFTWSDFFVPDFTNAVSLPERIRKGKYEAAYDLQGRRIKADATAKGIYVRQGRKYVVK